MEHSTFKLKMTKKVKHKLTELGVYDKWLICLKNQINDYKKQKRNKDITDHLCDIQDSIDAGDIKTLIAEIDWYGTEYGSNFWIDVYRSL